MSINSRLDNFRKQIRPTKDHIEEANRQVDHLIDRLSKVQLENSTIELKKVLKAGSNAKFTSLRRTAENEFDVDLGAYYEGRSISEIPNLLISTRQRLVEVYKGLKEEKDFVLGKSAVRIEFRSGIGLNVDVAPIVADDSLKIENGGYIPREDGMRLTSVTCHVNFVSSRSKASREIAGKVTFNNIVRLFKWWNNLQAPFRLPSLACEMIVAASVDRWGHSKTWLEGITNSFAFLEVQKFSSPIIFYDYYSSKQVPQSKDKYIVLDVVNPNNNIAREWQEKDVQDYLASASSALSALQYAKVLDSDNEEGLAIEILSEIFGPLFEKLSEPL